MHSCAKPADRLTALAPVLRHGLLVAVLAGLLPAFGGCSKGSAAGAFAVDEVQASWANGRMNVSYRQNLKLSPEAQTALIHGVALTVETEMILRVADTKTRVARHRSRYQVRFLPLSEHYELSRQDNDELRTYPRLRHALAAIGNSRVTFETGALPRGEYELLVRTYLDKQTMPPPMRLPALFSSRWRHESDWTTWPLTIEPGA
jgi:hypothetical protein